MAIQAGLEKFVRNEPEKLLPPAFVIVLMTPPANRPYSAEIPDVDVVVSWMASSMKRLSGVPRMLSMMLAPFIRKRLSYDWAPETVTAAFGPFCVMPGARATAESSVRVTGSLFRMSDV